MKTRPDAGNDARRPQPMRRGLPQAVAAALMLAALPAMASATTDIDGDPEGNRFRLGVVEVVGTRPDLANDVRVDVLDAEAIDRHARTDLSEALELLPGVTLQNIGGRSERLVFVRGFNSRQVPLFIDGIPVYVPYDGNIDLARLGVVDIAEVVVSKGLTSVLYGPNALGGSINIVTRRPVEPFEGRVRVGMDFDRELDRSGQRAELLMGTARDRYYLQLAGSWRERDFTTLPSDFQPTAVQPAGRRVNSGSEDTIINLRVGFTPRGDDEYALSLVRQRGEKQTPPYAGTAPGVRARFWRWPYYDKDSLYLLTRTGFGEDVTLRVRAFHDSFDNLLSSFDDASFTTQNLPFAFNSVYDDTSTGFGSDLEWRLAPGQVLRTALHYKRDRHTEVDDIGEPPENFEDRLWSLGVEHQWQWRPATRLVSGVAWHRQEGRRAEEKRPDGSIVPFEVGSANALNAQLVLTRDLDNGLRAFGGIARKTRFPTIKDRYTSRFGSALPNPDLSAEYSNNAELGIERPLGATTWRVAAFHSRLSDAIENVSLPDTACTSPPCSQLQNIVSQRNQGVEASLEHDFGEALTIAGNYTWLDRANRSQPEVLPLDTPEHSALLWAEWRPRAGWALLASGEYNSRRNSTTTGSRIADGFTVFNARARYRFDSGLELEAGVANLGDRLHAYEEGFFEPGRRYHLNLGYRF